jgi:hypothetical protein
VAPLTDLATTGKPTRVTCDTCGKRITEGQASIYSGTADGTRQRWHLACWPYRLKAFEPQGQHTGAP